MKPFRRIKTALIGSGAISNSYLTNIQEKFHILDVVACSDLIPERAQQQAEKYGIQAMTSEEIFANQEIEIVLNTTYPLSHYEVTKQALQAGKHVYTEKMLAVELSEGVELALLAKEKGLLLTAAPDTFLGGGWQTARNVIDNGWIGTPLVANGICVRSYKDFGDTLVDPKPFVFSPGGGIPFDMGGYYLHALIHLFGAVAKVSGFTKTRAQEKIYSNPHHPLFGKRYTADSPNTIVASLSFASGLLANLTITSESSIFTEPTFTVHGTQGSLTLFDPNNFGGNIYLERNTYESPAIIPTLYPYTDDSRGIGAADMAYALLNERPPRADVSIGLHAFEIVHKIIDSSKENKVLTTEYPCQRPYALPLTEFAGQAYESILNE